MEQKHAYLILAHREWAFAMLETLFLIFMKKCRNRAFLRICAFLNLIFSLAYIYIRLRPDSICFWGGAIIAILFLNISMAAFLQCVLVSLNKETSK